MRQQLEILAHLCRGRLDDLEAERSKLDAELEEYLAALKFDANEGDTERAIRSIERRFGNLTPTWRAILTQLARFKIFNIEDVLQVSNELHRSQPAIKRQTRGNVRFQLSTYTKKRLLERRGGGNYRISEKCRIELDLLARNVGGAATSPEDSDEIKVWARAGGSGPRTAGDAR